MYISLGTAGLTLGPGGLESDLHRVRLKLRKFLQRRPTLQSLREKGYIKGTQEGRGKRGALCMVYGAWYMVHGSQVHGTRCMVHGAWFTGAW